MAWKSAGVTRWGLVKDGTHKFLLQRMNSSGTFVDNAISVDPANSAVTLSGTLNTAAINPSNAIVSSYADAFRITQGNYGTYWRSDGTNLYLMSTASGDKLGGYNTNRPFSYSFGTGLVTLADSNQGLDIGSVVTLKNSTGTYSMPLRFNAGGYQPFMRGNSAASTIEFVNSANTALNFSVYDDGRIAARGAVYAGGGQLATDGNTYGTVWGGWLSSYLSNQLNAKVSTSNCLLYNGVLTMDACSQLGFIAADTNRPYLMQNRNGTTVELLLQRPGGAKVNSPTRSNGYIEWVTDIGTVGTNYFTSDEFYKENIAPNTKTYAQQVADIKFVSFDFKQNDLNTDAGRHWDLGVIAQQIESDLSDEYIDYLSDGTLSLNTNKLLVLALKTIQELNERVKTLEAAA
jgi:hypothetical protein